jgi:hypothetical protein
MNDLFQNKRTIQQQHRKLRSAMADMTVELSTHSKYNSLNRKDKRTAEHHHDLMVSEQSLQKDLRGVSTMARRIAQVLDRLRKDVNNIKNFAGNYNFTNTVGMDSSASGNCAQDLSTGIGTRDAWKQELINLISNSYQYVEAQRLGDYALLHDVSSSSNCCPVKYRSEFHYSAPRGDCLAFAPSMGSAHMATEQLTGDDDTKSTPGSYEHQSVQNCDLKFAQTYKLLVTEDATEWESVLAIEYANAVSSFDGSSTSDWDGAAFTTDAERKAHVKTYLQNESCLPEVLVDALLVFVDQVTFVISGVLATDVDASDIASAIAHVPSVPHVEDESDLAYIFKHFTEKMNTIRGCQQQNDREQQRMEFVRETSECNEAFHKDVFQGMTAIDESAVRSKRSVGMQLDKDLQKLYKDNCFTKGTMFNDIALNGGDW